MISHMVEPFEEEKGSGQIQTEASLEQFSEMEVDQVDGHDEEHIEDYSDENEGRGVKLDVGFKALFRGGRKAFNRSFNESPYSKGKYHWNL